MGNSPFKTFFSVLSSVTKETCLLSDTYYKCTLSWLTDKTCLVFDEQTILHSTPTETKEMFAHRYCEFFTSWIQIIQKTKYTFLLEIIFFYSKIQNTQNMYVFCHYLWIKWFAQIIKSLDTKLRQHRFPWQCHGCKNKQFIMYIVSSKTRSI